ncbi:MAG: hypothetical protein FWG33_00515 [Oscillospiraceae bacterium]|nr:hypothetical protein [Oscillospiraceae bacterium]
MKKTFILPAIAMIIAVAMTACSGVSTMNPDRLKIDKSYKFSANILYGELRATAEFERKDTQVWEVVLTEPFALEGMTLTYYQGEVTAYFEGLDNSQTLPASNNNTADIASLLICAFENAVNGEGREVISNGEEIRVSSRAGNPANSYELIFDKKSLAPVSMKIPEKSFTADFSEVQVSRIAQILFG